MTIQLELEIEEDVDSKIEGLAYLKRMGRFRKADQYFRDNLAQHLHGHEFQVRVALEYADMLLAQGDFRRIFELFDEHEITASCNNRAFHDLAAIGAEETCLLLTLHLARSYSDPSLDFTMYTAKTALDFLRARWKGEKDSLSTIEVRECFFF